MPGGGHERFRDREHAGRVLARELSEYAARDDVVVLALPRGGVPVGYEVARRLRAPLDVFLVHKLGAPGQEELAMGAIATGGVRVLNEAVLAGLGLAPEAIEAATASAAEELARRERLYRGEEPPPDLAGRTAILVDDGLATGATMRAAAIAAQQQRPAKVVVAAPVAAAATCESFSREVDDTVCVLTPAEFGAVGSFYEDFGQTSDDEVRALLGRAREWPAQ